MNSRKIYRQAWMAARPRAPKSNADEWYVDFANRLLPLVRKSEYMKLLPEGEEEKVALYLTWYLEDCVNNIGGWNRFIWFHKQIYGRYLPFYTLTDEYMADEVNLEDIQFILWSIADVVDEKRPKEPLDPFLSSIVRFATEIYAVMEVEFEQAPITDFDTADWFPDMEFMVMDEFDEDLFLDGDDFPKREKEDELALVPGETYQPDLEKFLAASGGEQLMYFGDYDELHRFMTGKLKWKEDELIPGLEDRKEFVFFASPKGLLLASEVAPFFADKHNSRYDATKAAEYGKAMLFMQGVCPSDLLKFGMTHNLFPDVAFSFPNGKEILHDNWDFIARRYLGYYYDGE